MTTNLETMKKMLEDAGIEYTERVYQEKYGVETILTIYGGYEGFSSSFTFVDSKLKSIEAYEG
jgi:hypothetical protein